MKNVINISLIGLVLVCIFSSLSVNAQPPKKHQPPPLPDSTQIVNRVNEMDTALDLTQSQKQQIECLMFEYFEEAKALHKKHKQVMEEQKQIHDKNRAKFDAEIKGVLNNEQEKAYDEFMQSKKYKKKSNKKL